MSYELSYLPEAVSDMQKLDGSQRKLVRKALAKLSVNPLPQTEGGDIIIIGAREDEEVYEIAAKRIQKNIHLHD